MGSFAQTGSPGKSEVPPLHPRSRSSLPARSGVARRLRLAALLALVPLAAAPPAAEDDDAAAAAAPPPATTAPADPNATAAPPARVIVTVNRNRTVAGTVELENQDVIVVRDERGELHSFSRFRVLGITRLVEPGPRQNGTVILRNGQVRTGIILEDAYEHVRIEINGIPTRLRRDLVDHVVLEPTFEEKYRQYKETLRPGMTERHLTLCRWLFEERRYDLSLRELNELLDATPDHVEAIRLHARALAQVQLQQRRDARTPSTPTGSAGDAATDADEPRTGPVDVRDLLPKELVSREDVNIIRVYEIDFARPPQVSVEPDTIRALFEKYGTSELLPQTQAERTALFRADGTDIVRLMFELRAREMYGQAKVLTEPRSLNLFRQRVHNTWLMNNCATSRCHGGPSGGRFFLHNRNHRDERVRYTNFLILERLELDPQWPLINYEQPRKSLLIQYGLPRDQADLKHPDVPGWKAVFRPTNQRLLRDAIEWIEAMMQPRPDYPVDYEPPVLNPKGPAGTGTRSPRNPR